jgi:hypothetical protein
MVPDGYPAEDPELKPPDPFADLPIDDTVPDPDADGLIPETQVPDGDG